MGSAVCLYSFKKPRRCRNIRFTGSRFRNEVETYLKSRNIAYKVSNLIYDIIAGRLIDSGVVGWFNGRANSARGVGRPFDH
jgi:carbamoyltransferase